jgi:hypothetical protein
MAYRAYRKKSLPEVYKDMHERRERKSTRVRKSMSKRLPSQYPDMGPQSRAHKVLAGSGMGFGEIVFPGVGPRELRALSAVSLGARRGASKVITERGYRYVKIIDKDDKNMDGKTGFLTDLRGLNPENRPSRYIITLDKPLANIFLYHTDDRSKFVDVPSGTIDSAHRTRINDKKLEEAIMRQEAMCDHAKPTCLQKVLTFLGFSSKFSAHKKSIKKTPKKSVKKVSKKTPKKSIKKMPKKSVKKTPKKAPKKTPKKM